MDVSVIVVNYNVCDYLDACLASIQSNTSCAYEIIVVDNASTDDSVAMVRERFPAAQLLVNHKNLGYSVANNQGAQVAKGRYLLLLNPDTLVWPGAIDQLVAFMDTHLEIGICAPQNRNGQDSKSFDLKGEIKINYYHFYSFIGMNELWSLVLNHLGLRTAPPLTSQSFVCIDGYILADWLCGCSVLVRTDLFHRLGGMDEVFFLYKEDLDLCRRIRQEGFGCAVLTKATIIHYGGVSSSRYTASFSRPTIIQHSLRSRYHYIRKAHGLRAVWSVRMADLLLGLYGLMRHANSSEEQSSQTARSKLRITEALRWAPAPRTSIAGNNRFKLKSLGGDHPPVSQPRSE
jgi:GT2 family glycosyltransferase